MTFASHRHFPVIAGLVLLLVYVAAACMLRVDISEAAYRVSIFVPKNSKEKAELVTQGRAQLPIELIMPGGPHETLLEMTLKTGWITPSTLYLLADKCLSRFTINGHSTTFPGLSAKERCKYGALHFIDVRGKLHNGENKLQVQLNKGRQTNRIQLAIGAAWLPGIRIEPIFGIALGIVFLLWLLRTSPGREATDPTIRILLWCGMVFYALDLWHYSFIFMSHDPSGHRAYITYLYEHLRMPGPQEGWEMFQPPLYYIAALPFYAAGKLMGIAEPVECVRYLGLICYLAFLVYSLAILQRLVHWKPVIYLAAALIIFWPAGMGMAGKLNNDVMIYPLFAAAVYYLLRWQQEKSVIDLWRAAGIAFISVGVKSTGMLLTATVGITALWHLLATGTTVRSHLPRGRMVLLLLMLFAVGFGSNIGRSFYDRIANDNNRHWLAGNQDFSRQPAKNMAKSSGLDVKTILLFSTPVKPLTEPFWNVTLKTLMLSTAGRYYYFSLATISSFLFLTLLAYTAISSLWQWQAARNAQSFLCTLGPVMGIISATGGMMYLWTLVSSTYSARFVYYCIPLILCLFARSIDWHQQQEHRSWKIVGLLIAAYLLICCLVFAALPHPF